MSVQHTPLNSEKLLRALREAQIIPDVIPSSVSLEASTPVEIKVSYKAGALVLRGNNLDVATTASLPREIHFSEPPGEGECYTLFMTDPDAPSRLSPSSREWAHWVVTGITGTTLEKGTAEGAITKLPYNGPSPPPNTGKHRYIFLLFKGPASKESEGGITGLPSSVGDSRKVQQRGKWGGSGGVWRIAAFNDLKWVGANWFTAG